MKYFYNSDYVANEEWQLKKKYFRWLPMTIIDPLPFLSALWARLAELGITNVFVVLTLIASLLLEELFHRASAMKEEHEIKEDNENLLSSKLETWRCHYDMICRLVDKINRIFAPILLVQIAVNLGVSFFEFSKILKTKGLYARLNFAYLHSILRFFLVLVPSYMVSQKVCYYSLFIAGIKHLYV